jgi:hypothetical protein
VKWSEVVGWWMRDFSCHHQPFQRTWPVQWVQEVYFTGNKLAGEWCWSHLHLILTLREHGLYSHVRHVPSWWDVLFRDKFIFIVDRQHSFNIFLIYKYKTIKLQMSISSVDENWLTSLNIQLSERISMCSHRPPAQKWCVWGGLTKPVTLRRVEGRALTTGRKIFSSSAPYSDLVWGRTTLQFIQDRGIFPRG